ncbi:MAG: helix-turn-helix domain-containing protein [Brevundimonas sp.]|uniref:helix-turn-helix domain-containing protein n=1 Tax=Brevundimonas sp. TaxID=1871086 RepID=UPI0040343C13
MADGPIIPDYATPTQAGYLRALHEHGSQRKAAAALGVAPNAIWESLDRLKKEGSRRGHAPGHFDDGTAPGYRMGKVTVQRGPGGVERVWERQHPEELRLEELMRQCDERLKSFPRFRPAAKPKAATGAAAQLTNFLGLFDLHIGEKISSTDPAGRWDIATAKRTIRASVEHSIATAPKAKRLVLCVGGDAAPFAGPIRRLRPVQGPRQPARLHDGDLPRRLRRGVPEYDPAGNAGSVRCGTARRLT